MCQPVNKENTEFRFEDTILALKQMFTSGKIIGLTILYICSIATFNFGGVSVTKYASATSRTIINTLRTILIWTFFLLNPYVPESTEEHWSWLQFAGFLLLITGTIIYNEIVEIPCGGFNENTKRAIRERNQAQQQQGTEANVVVDSGTVEPPVEKALENKDQNAEQPEDRFAEKPEDRFAEKPEGATGSAEGGAGSAEGAGGNAEGVTEGNTE